MTRGHHRLRHDRDQPGQLPDLASTIRSSGASPPSAASIRMSRSRSSTPRAASCRAGTPGELLHPRLFGDARLLGRRGADRARRSTRAGWMHTGDLATIDDGGLLQHRRPHQGHGDPRRRERLSARDRGVPLPPSRRSQDVQVVGVPDAEIRRGAVRLGQAASPASSADAEEIRAFCQGQIAHYKIPRYVRFVDAFPMTVTGKVQKFLMREADDRGARPERAEDGLSDAGGRLPHWNDVTAWRIVGVGIARRAIVRGVPAHAGAQRSKQCRHNS